MLPSYDLYHREVEGHPHWNVEWVKYQGLPEEYCIVYDEPHGGSIIGIGDTYEEAIADAEKNTGEKPKDAERDSPIAEG